VIYLAIYIYAFYLLFVVTMAAKVVWKDLPIAAKCLLAPAALVAVFMDVFFNLFIASFIFMDFPEEFMFTQRLSRYKNSNAGWRTKVAKWLCFNLLDVFELGGHCR
jgi:hypothetical protein